MLPYLMKQTSAIILLCVALVGIAIAAPAQAPKPKSADTSKYGYWWKRERVQEQAADTEHPELGPPPAEQVLLAMHPQNVEKLIEQYREYALWRMRPETVKWYFELQDFARRRARAFMNTTEVVMLQNPDLNMQTVYPTNPSGQAARVAQRSQEITTRLAREKNNAALIMLVKEGCQYCEAQRPILKMFKDRYGWDVRELDIERVPGAAQKFGTDFTPTTIIIFRDRPDWAPVALGVETLEKVEEGAYRALRFINGEVDPQQYTLQGFQDGGLYDPQKRQK
jgi:conjugal transfer pilus assembly protein TraF